MRRWILKRTQKGSIGRNGHGVAAGTAVDLDYVDRPTQRAPFETAAGKTRPPQGERLCFYQTSFSAHPELLMSRIVAARKRFSGDTIRSSRVAPSSGAYRGPWPVLPRTPRYGAKIRLLLGRTDLLLVIGLRAAARAAEAPSFQAPSRGCSLSRSPLISLALRRARSDHVVCAPAATIHYRQPSCCFAASDIMAGLHGGSHTMSTCTACASGAN